MTKSYDWTAALAVAVLIGLLAYLAVANNAAEAQPQTALERITGSRRALSPTIDPATCAVYILVGHMANPKTTEQMSIDVAYYEGDLQMEHFAAVDRVRQDLVRSAFEMCAFLQTAVVADVSSRDGR